MEYSEVKKLLEKYWAGETSVEEEMLLADYMSGEKVHPEFAAFKSLFSYYNDVKGLQMQNDFDEKILAFLQKEDQKKNTVRKFNFSWVRVAAIFLIAAGLGTFIYHSASKHQDTNTPEVAQSASTVDCNTEQIKDTYSSPEEARKGVEQALAVLSSKMNKGKNITEKGISKIETINKVMNTQD